MYIYHYCESIITASVLTCLYHIAVLESILESTTHRHRQQTTQQTLGVDTLGDESLTEAVHTSIALQTCSGEASLMINLTISLRYLFTKDSHCSQKWGLSA